MKIKMKERNLCKFLYILICFLVFNPPAQSHVVKSVSTKTENAETDKVEVTTTADSLSDVAAELKGEAVANTQESFTVPRFPLFGELINPLLPIDNAEISSTTKKTNENSQPSSIVADNVTVTAEILLGILPQEDQTKLSCSCGIPMKYIKNCEEIMNVDHNDCKIVGGQAAFIRDFPWTVALVRKYSTGFGGTSRPFCGGTLINNRYVLTASHCVDGQSARDIQILVNEQDISTENEVKTKTMKIDAQQIIMHHAYSRTTIDNDIALILLAKSVDISSPISITRPACISGSSHDFAGSIATVVGWGAKTQGGQTSDTLQKVDVPVISNTHCNEGTTYGGKITQNMLCAGNVSEGGKDSCQGDSGGPLIATHGGRKTLIGIVSWGHGCAQPKSPGVYTRVSRYADWILQNTRQGDWCDG